MTTRCPSRYACVPTCRSTPSPCDGENTVVSLCRLRGGRRNRPPCQDYTTPRPRSPSGYGPRLGGRCSPSYSLPRIPLELALMEQLPLVCDLVNASANNDVICNSQCPASYACARDVDPRNVYPSGIVASVCSPLVG